MKFTSVRLKVVTIINIARLKTFTVQDIIDADIVVVADTVFKSAIWWQY